ncbi:MAG: hypothetical protein EHM47_16650 [Ignavibacteriales bacterium]|nr:MAG: hypothetical protein EHM47_16650 [Ignavibacteriales bacterium]
MKIKDAVNQNVKGLYFNNRIILPFQAHFLKMIIDDEIYTDFSVSSKHLYLSEESNFTNIYIRDFRSIKDAVSKYEAIKLIVVEKNEDIFNIKNHIKIALYPEGDHFIKIELTDEDILLIE